MNGMFELKMFNNRGLKDNFFQDAIDGKYIMDLLDDLPVNRHLPAQNNRIFDNFAGCILDGVFSGPNHADGEWAVIVDAGTANALLHYLCLSNASSATTNYQEDDNRRTPSSNTSISHTNITPNSVNTSSAAKRFIDDDITDPTIWSDTAREAIHFRNRFLYLPSQGNSNAIKSIEIYASEDGDASTLYYDCVGRVGRIRLRDADGVYTTLNKTSSNSLLVEYTFTLVSW